MKNVLFVFLLLPFFLGAQMPTPVEWKSELKKINKNEYEVRLTASIQSGWYVYSSKLPSDDGPVATSLFFDEADSFALVGELKEEGDKIEGYDAIFDMDISKYKKEVTFVQKIKVSGKNSQIKGEIEFMTCNDQRCLPPRSIPFNLSVK
ncbi:MAG: protein-disulfide reductase DsbD domain-containing protein [Bacteroidota bacterium]